MTCLLDTSACIAYLNGRALGVRRRLEATDPQEIVLCSVVRAELIYGAMRSVNPAKTLAKQAPFLNQFASLPFDDRAAEVYGRIRAQLAAQGTLIGPNDLLIAAIAIANDAVLVTRTRASLAVLTDCVSRIGRCNKIAMRNM